MLSGESVLYFFIPLVSQAAFCQFSHPGPPGVVLWECICPVSRWSHLFPANDRGRGNSPGGNELEMLLPVRGMSQHLSFVQSLPPEAPGLTLTRASD